MVGKKGRPFKRREERESKKVSAGYLRKKVQKESRSRKS